MNRPPATDKADGIFELTPGGHAVAAYSIDDETAIKAGPRGGPMDERSLFTNLWPHVCWERTIIEALETARLLQVYGPSADEP